MSSRSPLLRALLFLLAFVPVVWGTCPRWVVGETCGAPASPEARCPCCPAPDPDGDPSEPFDSGSCPVIQLRHTLVVAPADVVVPPMDLAPVAVVVASPVALASAPARALAPLDPSGGAPPPLVGTVVLVV